MQDSCKIGFPQRKKKKTKNRLAMNFSIVTNTRINNVSVVFQGKKYYLIIHLPSSIVYEREQQKEIVQMLAEQNKYKSLKKKKKYATDLEMVKIKNLTNRVVIKLKNRTDMRKQVKISRLANMAIMKILLMLEMILEKENKSTDTMIWNKNLRLWY